MNRTAKATIAALAAANLLLLGAYLGNRGGPAAPAEGDRPPSALSLLDPADRVFATPPASNAARRTPIVEAAEKAGPSVVSITAMSKQVVASRDPFFSEFFNPYLPFRMFEEEVPTLGSGLIVGRDGYVMTNHHVVEGAASIRVSLPDGREFPARLVDADTYVDIAVLKVDGKDLPAAELGKTGDLMVGEWVLAIGNPFGAFDEDPHPSVSAGVISATNRFFRPGGKSGPGSRYYQNMIQTDASINPGNSGGPLVNILGQVVGINTFIISGSGGSTGVGFAIPIDRAAAVYDEVRRYGRVRPLQIDFRVRTLNRTIARHLGLADEVQGAIVSEIIEEGGSAAAAGMRLGDVIVRADAKPIRSGPDLSDYFYTLQVEAKVQLEVLRDGKKLALTYVIREGR